jgi:effector-binding domain-containing protein
VLPAWQALARWIDDNGYRSGEPAREHYLDCPDDPAEWVTELQEPLVSPSGPARQDPR